MTVLRNEGRWDRSNVIYQAGQVVLYDKCGVPGMQYIDYGLSCFRRELFDDETPADLAALFHQLSLSGHLAGFEVHQRFYEIGSPSGLRDFEQYLESQADEAPASSLLFVARQFGQHRKIFQRGRVALHFAAGGELAQQPPHDLAAARLRQRIGEPDVVRLRDRPDLLAPPIAAARSSTRRSASCPLFSVTNAAMADP